MDATHGKLAAARSEFYGYGVGGAAVVALVLMLPKDPAAPGNRLVMTVCLFGGLLTTLWGLTGPLGHFLMTRCGWRYRDAGPALEHTGKLYASALSGYVASLAWVLMALVGFTALRVLAQWPQFAFMAPAGDGLIWGWWLALLALPGYLIGTMQRLADVLQRGRALAEQELTSGFVPPTEPDEDADQCPAVQVLAPGVFRAGGHDWHWDDFHKNLIVFGQPGSGKTVCVLNALLDGLLSAGAPPAGGLILDPKGDFRDKLEVLCRRLGRASDLLILDPSRPDTLCWNPFDNAEDETELAGRFVKVLETLGTRNESDSFFIEAARIFMQHALGLLRAANPPGTPPAMAQIMDLANNPPRLHAYLLIANIAALLHTLDTRAPFTEAERLVENDGALGEAMAAYFSARHPPNAMTQLVHDWWDMDPDRRRQVLAQARAIRSPNRATAGLPVVGEALDLARDYFLNTWFNLAPETRSSIQAQLVNMLNPFLVSPYRQVFGRRSSLDLGALLDDGRLLYVYMPVAEREVMSRVVCTFIKIAFQREVLRRRRKPRPSFFFCDEYQQFFTADSEGGQGDEDFLARSRESNHANIIATQNMPSLLKRTRNEKSVTNLLGLCATKVFLRNSDDDTNDYASKVFGERLETLTNVQTSTGGARLLSVAADSPAVSGTTQYGAVVRKEVFAALAQPSPAEGSNSR